MLDLFFLVSETDPSLLNIRKIQNSESPILSLDRPFSS